MLTITDSVIKYSMKRKSSEIVKYLQLTTFIVYKLLHL